jgi:hypothetical protein
MAPEAPLKQIADQHQRETIPQHMAEARMEQRREEYPPPFVIDDDEIVARRAEGDERVNGGRTVPLDVEGEASFDPENDAKKKRESNG